MADSADPAALAERLGYAFTNPDLLATALVHRSAPNERDDCPESYERLEFLGDAVLDLVIAQALFTRFPEAAEGELTRYKATLVAEPALADIARFLRMGEHLVLGRGEEETGGRNKPSLLSDAFEAVLGAIYLDGGMGRVKPIILKLFADGLEHVASRAAPRGDYKTALQEWTQSHNRGLPAYTLLETTGPDHARHYTVAVSLNGEELARGEGKSKRGAERAAARSALARLDGETSG